MDTTTTTDRIAKEILLRAPLARVWRAISDPDEFGSWFRVDMSGVRFEPGKPVHAKMTYPGHEGTPFEMVVDRMEAPRRFSFRWHPYGIDRILIASRASSRHGRWPGRSPA